MTTAINTDTASYVLGDTESERRRLQLQSDLIGGFTRHVFEQAGIAAGMKVLDVGSGAGDVALLLADMVGPTGRVVGVDRNPAIVSTARQRVAAAGHTNVAIVARDINDPGIDVDSDFDAAVGRAVLMYNQDPVATLRATRECVVRGGIVAFQEVDFTFFGHSVPTTPLMIAVHDWIGGAFAASGSDVHLGFRLPQLFARAGLPRPHLQFNTYMGSGPDFGGYEYAAATLRSLLPMIERSGIATAAEIGVDTLADRLRAEITAADATLTTVSLIAAWSRLADE